MAAMGSASGWSSGIRTTITTTRISMEPVKSEKRPLPLLILPPDSNVESSNMASLESDVYLPLI
jgi:hypothetical protein